jgi:hypothetical protein
VKTSSFGSSSVLGSQVVASGGPAGTSVSIKVRFASDFPVSSVFTSYLVVVRELVLCLASEWVRLQMPLFFVLTMPY